MIKRCVIFDIDKTIADNMHRNYLGIRKDWDSFHGLCHLDQPITPMINLLHVIRLYPCEIIYSTARPNSVRKQTEDWIKRHVGYCISEDLHMRGDNDTRPSAQVKKDHLDIIRKTHHILYAFDDQEPTIKMYSDNNIYCIRPMPINRG